MAQTPVGEEEEGEQDIKFKYLISVNNMEAHDLSIALLAHEIEFGIYDNSKCRRRNTVDLLWIVLIVQPPWVGLSWLPSNWPDGGGGITPGQPIPRQ